MKVASLKLFIRTSMNSKPFKLYLVFLHLTIFSLPGFSEGTKQLLPDSTVSAAGLFFDNTFGSNYPNFGIIGCQPNYRLNIHVKNAGEYVLFGLKASDVNLQFNLRKPDGTIALSGICPFYPGQPGYIRYYHQAIVGPFPNAGGYSPFSYQVTSMADTGNYYFELFNLPAYFNTIIDYWDFQVVSGQHSPPVQDDTINGRVWSQSWQVYADLGNFVFQPFNGKFYVYSDDGIVTKLSFSDAHVGAATIFCNPYGCLNTGNFISDRQSKNSNTYNAFPGIAQYKVFLNDPDSTVYPSGVYGEIIGTPIMIPDPDFPPCSGNKQIVVNVNKTGNIEIKISFPYGGSSTMVSLYAPVVPGTNFIDWNGLDGLGNHVPDGTMISVSIKYLNGLTNLPIWDQEQNPDGFLISLIRPANPVNPTPLTYWDDSQLVPNVSGNPCNNPPQTTNLAGCTPGSMTGYEGCHPWAPDGYDCHDKMINTWWFGNTSTASFDTCFIGIPANPEGHGASRCGPGTVTLYATVLPTQTVDWYAMATGGIPLLAGDTLFVTPIINTTTTFYAEARNTYTSCFSASRTPVVATILPNPVPTISGPDTVCTGTSDNFYTTEPGMIKYNWNVSAGGSIIYGYGTNVIAVRWNYPGAQSVSVDYMDTNGCTALILTVYHVMVNPLPVPVISGPDSVCSGTTGNTYVTDPGMTNYIWTVTEGGIITDGAGTSHITVKWITPGAQSVGVKYTDAHGCGADAPSNYPVMVNPLPPPAGTIDGTSTVCAGTKGVGFYAAPVAGALTYTWGISPGTVIVAGDGTDSITVDFAPDASSGDFTVFATTACGNGLPSPPFPVTVNLPSIAFAGEDLFTCESFPVVLSGSFAENYISLWWISSGTGTFSDPAALHPQYTPGTEDVLNGSVILTLTAIAPAPCTADTSCVTLTIARKAKVSAGADNSVCEGQDYFLNDANALDYTSLLWSTSGTGSFSNPQTIHPVYNPGKEDIMNGQVLLTLTATSPPCLPVSGTMNLSILKIPVIQMGPDGTVCQDTPYQVIGTAVQNYSSLLWTHNGSGTLADATTLIPTYFPSAGETGDVILTLTAQGKAACSDTFARNQMKIAFNEPPFADAGDDQLIESGTSTSLTGAAEGGSGVYSFRWEPASLLLDNATENPVTEILTRDTTFTFMVHDLISGCTAGDSVRVRIWTKPNPPEEECIVIHNVITPNDDGLNDTWIIDCIGNFPDNKVVIFDRWGDRINEFENYNNTTRLWKGTNLKDEKVPDGTYYYVLTIKNGSTRTGWVFVRGGAK